MKKKKLSFLEKFRENKQIILRVLLICILLLHIFLRFYELEERNGFAWDQVDNAWAAKDILIDHKFPLVGMQAKQNSGIYIGPLYYYYVTPFYLAFGLDPLASPVIAGVTSIITLFTFYVITKKLFTQEFALLVVFMHTISFHVIVYDRTQWPINFIAPLSYVIFYFLYKVVIGNPKYLILLALSTGLSFHLNFTAIFFPLIILAALPFFPRNKQTIKYALLSIPLFLLFFIPNFIAELQSKQANTKSLSSYIETYSHGLHLRRILQVSNDALIEFEGILVEKFLKYFKYILPIAFAVVYYFQKPSKERLLFVYLVALFFIVPWGVFSMYKGEISDYYFALTRPFVILIISYLLFQLFIQKYVFAKVIVVAILVYYSTINFSRFMAAEYQGLSYQRFKTEEAIKNGEKIEFVQGDPKSYIFFVKTHK